MLARSSRRNRHLADSVFGQMTEYNSTSRSGRAEGLGEVARAPTISLEWSQTTTVFSMMSSRGRPAGIWPVTGELTAGEHREDELDVLVE